MADNYTALYKPTLDKALRFEMYGLELCDRSRDGFDTKEEAEKYIITQICDVCKERRRRVLAGEEYEPGFFEDIKNGDTWAAAIQEYDMYPSHCCSDWTIVPSQPTLTFLEIYKQKKELERITGWVIP